MNEPMSRPTGKISKQEMLNVIPEESWYQYVAKLKAWANDNDKDLGIEQRVFKDTRDRPRKYYRADIMLEWWRSEMKHIGHDRYQSVEHRLRRFAEELQ